MAKDLTLSLFKFACLSYLADSVHRIARVFRMARTGLKYLYCDTTSAESDEVLGIRTCSI